MLVYMNVVWIGKASSRLVIFYGSAFLARKHKK